MFIALRSPPLVPWTLLTVPALLAACSTGGDSPTAAPGGGVIEIQAVETGLHFSRALSVSIDGRSATELAKPRGYEGGWARIFVPAGSHRVELMGLAPNCSVADGTRVEVSVQRQEPAPVWFDVRCTADQLLPAEGAAFLTYDGADEWGNSRLMFLSQGGVPSAANRTAGAFAWAPDGDRLVVQDMGRVDVIDRNGKVLAADLLASRNASGRTSHEVGWSPDGNTLAAMTFGGLDGTWCVLHLMEGPRWTTGRTLGCGDRYWSDLEWSPAGEDIALARTGDPGGVEVSLLSARTGLLTALPAIPSSSLAGLTWSPDGSQLVIGLQRGSELAVVAYEPGTGAYRQIVSLEGMASMGTTLEWASDGGSLLVGPVADSNQGSGASPGMTSCRVIAVVPIAAPDEWRPLLPCGDVIRLSVPRRPLAGSVR